MTQVRHFAFLILFPFSTVLCSTALPTATETKTTLAAREAANDHFQQAIVLLKEKIAEDSTLTEIYLRMADYYRCGKNLAEGESYFRDAIGRYPENPNLYVGYALVSKYQNDWSGVFENSKRALEQGSTHPVAVALQVEAALQLKKTNGLAALLRKLKKKTAQAHLYELGYALWRFRLKNLKKAKGTLLKYLASQPDAYGHKLLGDVYRDLGDFAASNSHYLRAKRQAEQNLWGLDITLMRSLALNYFELGQLDSADYYYSEALRKANSDGARYEQLEADKASLLFHKSRQKYEKLAEVCLDGIQVSNRLNETENLPIFYFNLAFAEQKMGDRKRALESYLLAAEHAKELRNARVEAEALIEIGQIQMDLQAWAQALDYLGRGMQVAASSGDQDLRYLALLKIGDSNRALGNSKQAQTSYKKVLKYGQRTQQHHITEICFLKLADLHLKPLSDLGAAHYYLRLAEHLWKQTFQLQYAANLRWMEGNLALMRNDIEKAEVYFSKAIQLGRETGSYVSILAGNAGLIKTYLRANFPRLAAARSDTLLSFLAEFGNLCLEENTAEFLDLKEDLFIPAIHAYSAVGDLTKMYRVYEQYKSSKRIQSLSKLKYTIKPSPADRIKRKIDIFDLQIKQNWTDLWELWRKDKGDNLGVLLESKRKINQLVSKRRELYFELAESHPEYFSLFYPSVGGLDQLRSTLQQSSGSLVHYLVGDKATDILVVRPDSIYYRRVDVSRRYLEKLLAPTSLNGQNEIQLDLAAELYELVFKPLTHWMPKDSVVFIATDDILARLPFECLVTNPVELTDIHDYSGARFLIEDYSILYIPSAEFLTTKSRRKNIPKRSLIAFANSEDYSANGRNGSNRNGLGWPMDLRLKAAEIDAVVEAVGQRTTKVYSGKNSTKERFLAEGLRFKIIHLALPVLLETGSGLHSKLFFSSSGAHSDYVETHDLFGLSLNTDLVVFSGMEAEETNAAESKSLETLVHAAHYAGVLSLVTNLWQGDRAQSMNLLEYFYSNLTKGLNKAEALRKAKLRFMEEVTRNPYQWAPFVLIGSPEPVHFHSPNLDYLIDFTLIGVLALLALVVWQYLRIRRERAE